MYLKDLAASSGIDVIRDAEFESLGKARDRKTKMLTFLESDEHLRAVLRNKGISCVVTTPELASMLTVGYGVAVCPEPRLAFYQIHDHLRLATDFYGRSFASNIHPSATVHPTAHVALTDVRIRRGSIIEAHAVVLGRTVIGEESIIRDGAVIGSDGFEFRRVAGRIRPVPDSGGVKLGDRVEIQHNSVIQKAPYGGSTTVENDTKIGALVTVAHNCRVGRRCLIAEGSTIGGNSVIGDDVTVGSHCLISTRVRVGDGARITVGAVVVRDVKPGQTVTGNFAIEHQRFLRFSAHLLSSKDFEP
jgi:UDP-3-O-[3-hydroxymyristoyl] glucosamine N-acyltransferase